MAEPARHERFALLSLGAISVATVVWWALALWPLSPAIPEWIERARAVCFGTRETGLPNSGGWVLLIGTPLSMIGGLIAIAPRELNAGLRRVASSSRGRAVLAGAGIALLVLVGAAVVQIASATGLTLRSATSARAEFEPRPLSRPAPPLGLVDQHGERFGLDRYQGRPVVVTFAYGKCESVCPLIVHNVLAARSEVPEIDPAIVIVTLDPWRDTLQRLPEIARSWHLPEAAHLLGGGVEDVERVLDAWQVERSRDLRTGEILHPSLAYLIAADGRIAYAMAGNTEQIVASLRHSQVQGESAEK